MKSHIQITDILQCTHDEYCEYQFESGMAQIAKILPDAEEAKSLSYSKEYWDAFKRNWQRQDEEFIQAMRIETLNDIIVKGKPCSEEVFDMYCNFHGNVAFESLPVAVQHVINKQLYKEQKAVSKQP